MKLKTFIITLCFIFLAALTSAAEDTYIVKFNDSVQFFGAEENSPFNFTVATAEEVQEYVNAGIVEYYEPNYTVYALAEEETQKYNLEMVKAAFPEKLGALGNDVRVAVIDSGLSSYPEIQEQILPGYDYITDKETYADVDNDNLEGKLHGTFVSTIIAHCGSGVAQRAHIVPLRCLYYDKTVPGNVGELADLVKAIWDAVDKYNCDVINISMGMENTGGAPKLLTEAVNHAIKEGVIVVAAVGNEGKSDYMYPAAIPGVIGVGSVGEDKVKSEFSRTNDSVDVVAPGENLVVTIQGTDFGINDDANITGTSFSAPHVSGLAAIAKCINPDITCAEFLSMLEATSEDLGEKGYDTSYGYGLIDCEKAIRKLIEGRKAYISPVVKKNGKTSVTVYNNTASKLNFKSIFALYGDSFSVTSQDKSLETGETLSLENDYSSGTVRYMVWDGFKNLLPLAIASSK